MISKPPQTPTDLRSALDLTKTAALPHLTGVARAYERFMLLLMALTPLGLIAYLQAFQDPQLLFHHHAFHELAIGFAILTSAGITLVSFLCYRSSGEPLLRWLTLSLLAFTVVYAPHGILTRFAADNPPLFLLFGPASRLAMAAFLLRGLLAQHDAPDTPAQRLRPDRWWPWVAAMFALNALVVYLATSPTANPGQARLIFEFGAIILSLVSVMLLLRSPRLSPLLLLFALAICFFAQSSVSFLLSSPWNHQWWLAHAIFASGFMLISFGLLRAFLTTRRIVEVFSTEQWLSKVLEANSRVAQALTQLEESNRQLALLANIDGLTDMWNRRHFMQQASAALAQANARQAPMTVLIIDLDHFKAINDAHGHETGDRVLKCFAEMLRGQLRQTQNPMKQRTLDLIGRIGGEEFALALPDTPLAGAKLAAERVRKACEQLVIKAPDGQIVKLSTSIGVAASPDDGNDLSALLAAADTRLYAAKAAGRNQVHAA